MNNFSIDPKILEELERQKISEQLQSGQQLDLPQLQEPDMKTSTQELMSAEDPFSGWDDDEIGAMEKG